MKSNVSDCLRLVEQVYIDATTKCVADVFDIRDLFTIKSRAEHEGMSFLTITLPRFCNAFENALQYGQIDSKLFLGFNIRKGQAIPDLFQGMLSQMFDRQTGRLTADEDHPQLLSGDDSSDIPTIVESVRQICLTFKKVELDCTPERVQAALDNFVSIEQTLKEFSTPTEDTAEFLAVSSLLWDDMVANYTVTESIPKHGPGATAERISGNQKYAWQEWYDRLEPYFPLIDNAYPLGTPSSSEELQQLSIITQDEERPVRVVLVPKTLKSPRVIAIEPCCMQYVQQGIRDWLYRQLESYKLTAGHVNFRDQSINQDLALASSMTGLFATIDLSDASDRVPRDLALEMFRKSPVLRDSIDACRSTKAELPDGRLVAPLRKFASMGSALCFPIEAMYFYTICVVALLKEQKLPVTWSNIYHVTRGLYVYGDDIIVPTYAATSVLDHLQKYNCKVNTNKTFVSGSFRESCGVDAYKGYEVTPTYIRRMPPENRHQVQGLISWVETANSFYLKGYWRTTSFMFNHIEKLVGKLPYKSQTSSYLGRISFLGFLTIQRWCKDLQSFKVRALVPSPVDRTDHLEGYGALMKCFLDMEATEEQVDLPLQENSKLESSALHGAVALKRRWVTAS